MAIYKQKGSKNWWYKFNWNGELIRESRNQANKPAGRGPRAFLVTGRRKAGTPAAG